ncbi:MAG: ATP-binding cassette domain-containing protein [Planctomycetia bacterium]|nr:ATP-binding cassette domain-containing protein [Planctomycetia bacterium]
MIRINSLIKHYDNGLVKALNGVTFNLSIGEVCSIMGPSGCGKTTLLNLIGALDIPTAGNIFIDGTNLSKIASKAMYRNRTLGFIFQFHNLIPNITLVENVELPTIAISGMNRVQRRDTALKLLSEVGLDNRTNFLPTQVSGGERQLTAVARALVNSPKILLADEPTGNVDSDTAALIMSIILQRSKKDNMTTLIVSHNKDIARQTERTLFMRDGCLVD